MKPSDRENLIYSKGKENPIESEERVLFSFLRKQNLRILDVGCGSGKISSELKKGGHDVVGIDFSKVAVETAKQKGLQSSVVDVDSEGLPFETASFDVVWLGDIIEHVFDPLNLLHEARRVIKEEGQILITTPNEFSIRSRIRILLTGKAPQEYAYKAVKISKHHTYFSWQLLKFMLEENNLFVKSYRTILKLPGLKEIICKKEWVGKNFGRIFIIEVKRKNGNSQN